MTYHSSTKVRFAHVDAAGIVFYPRYFEMLNGAIEDWFADVGGADFATLHLRQGIGVPTARLTSRFHAPSRLGDKLDITVDVVKVGRSSACFETRFLSDDGQARVDFESVLVCIDLASGRPLPWPETLRAALGGDHGGGR